MTRKPTHPGTLMKEVLETVQLTPDQAALALNVPVDILIGILDGKEAVSPDLADRFGKLVGGDPHLYVLMQNRFDQESK